MDSRWKGRKEEEEEEEENTNAKGGRSKRLNELPERLKMDDDDDNDNSNDKTSTNISHRTLTGALDQPGGSPMTQAGKSKTAMPFFADM